MDEQQVANFKQQIQSNIYDNAFSDVDKWCSHIIYMIYNPEEYWLNVLSIFNFRKVPVKVLRHSDWKDLISPAIPIIKKGLTGIPILVKDRKVNKIGLKEAQEKIVHDAWDINDLMDGEKLNVTAPFFDEMKNAQKNEINLDFNYWNDFVNRILESHFSTLSSEVKVFLRESFLYLIFGDKNINFNYINVLKDNTDVMCRIYKNMSVFLKTTLEIFRTDILSEKAKLISDKEKEAFFVRMERKLPQRLDDAEKRLAKKEEK